MAIDRRDTITIVILSLFFFIIAAYNLGSHSTPKTTFTANGYESFYLDLGSTQKIDNVYVLIKRGETTLTFSTGSPNSWQVSSTNNLDGYYVWKTVGIDYETRFLRIELGNSQVEIAEICVTGANDKQLGIKSIVSENNDSRVNNLIDEQNKIKLPITYLSETYFDEIYFVRAAEDYLNLHDPFEWTHPPLGKLIIAAGIELFGFNPFGWRIMGVLFATLMIPVIYILGKKMFSTWFGASVSAFLLMFDFMHFTMGRMATVDTFVVFFSLVSLLFFFTYFQDIERHGKNASTWSLFGAATFFSLAFATKWHSLLGFAGQMIILMAIIISWMKASRGDVKFIDATIVKLALKEIGYLAVGAGIYILSFIPYMMIGHTLMDVFNRQWQMFHYHATLVATHPFASKWWSWPIIGRPVWLYLRDVSSSLSSTIVVMGNPAVWWFGIFAIIYLADKAVRQRDQLSLFLVVIFLSQWLPFAFIGRITFLYHYYLDVPVLCLASAYVLDDFWSKNNGKKIVSIYLVVVLILFLVFYPVISGQPVTESWRESLRWMKSWVF
jgi:dolichyl-phosphate-mannose-protein mannosyltransferase